MFAIDVSTQVHEVSMFWVILSYLFQSLGELFVSALGLSLMAQWAPPALYNTCMGSWFVVQAAGTVFAGWFDASSLSLNNHMPVQQMLNIYHKGFADLGYSALGIGVIVICIAPFVVKALAKLNRH
jgi:POT family proton-dependent oligopeptide transporter